jgi:NADH:ubiquinone oxidoreductase subunit E
MNIDTKDISTIIKKYNNKKSAMLAVLQDIQTKYNWLPPKALELVAVELCVPLIDVYSVATFYRAFSLTPRGKHICTVCLGTACHVRGAPIVLDRIENQLGVTPGKTTKDDNFTLETVNCLGACALAPIVVVDGEYYGQTTSQKVGGILGKYQKKVRTASPKKTARPKKAVKKSPKKKK